MVTAVTRCFLAQLDSSKITRDKASANLPTRGITKSDRNAGGRFGQEQNWLVLVFSAPNNLPMKWFLRIEPSRATGVARADVHFFLDFRSKEPYI